MANTPANKSAINERIDLQVAKEREMEEIRNKVFRQDSQALGISRQMVSDEQRRVNLLQLERDGVADQIRTRQFASDEENQALALRKGQLDNELRAAKAEAAVAESQFRLVQQTTTIQRANISVVSQRYQTEQATLATLREQYAVVEKINESQARGLKLTIDQHENAVRELRQGAFYGKSPGQVQSQITRDRKNRINRGKFDDRMDRDDGLLSIDRDASGNALSGFDPLLGARRPVHPGKGRGEQGLHTGGLETGGLSTSGTTGSMFGGADLFEERHKALVGAGKIDRGSVADKLANPTANGFGDPRAALDQAPIWRDLRASRSHRGESLSVAVQRQILTEHVKTNSLMEKLIQSQHALPGLFRFG